MKLIDNFNGRQASHSSCRAVAHHIKIGNAQIGSIKLGNAEIGRMEWAFSATVQQTVQLPLSSLYLETE